MLRWAPAIDILVIIKYIYGPCTRDIMLRARERKREGEREFPKSGTVFATTVRLVVINFFEQGLKIIILIFAMLSSFKLFCVEIK